MSIQFPDDENGDVLRRMLESGDDLSLPREIDFTVVFPREREAAFFAEHFRKSGYKTKYERSDAVPDLPWDVVVVRFMKPEHAEIGAFEEQLQRLAEPLGGRNDGWGCFQQPPPRS